MNSIAVCNTSADNLSLIDIESYSVNHIPLDLGEKPVGPHGIEYKNNKIFTANNYSNSISIIDIATQKEENNLYVGAHPNDIKLYKKNAYIACGESNSLSVMDMGSEKIIFDIELEAYPHSIAIDDINGIAYISNMDGHSVSILDCSSNKIIGRIKAPEYPTKILLSKDKKMLYLCESYLGYDIEGYINIISTSTLQSIGRVRVGITPVDMYEDGGRLYISNFTEGSISIVDINRVREIKRMYIGGMPRGIIKHNKKLYIGDYMSGKLKIIDFKEETIKSIPLGKEPNGMIFID